MKNLVKFMLSIILLGHSSAISSKRIIIKLRYFDNPVEIDDKSTFSDLYDIINNRYGKKLPDHIIELFLLKVEQEIKITNSTKTLAETHILDGDEFIVKAKRIRRTRRATR